MDKLNTKIQTWFVTGASSGVGYEICKQLLGKGHNVIAVSRRIPNFEHKNALCLSCDVTNEKSVNDAINSAIRHFGRIDVLSNNAGISTSNIIEEETVEHMKEIMETNFFGTFNTIKAILPHFRENKNGLIINNSSQSGLVPRTLGGAYCSSKHAIEGLTSVCFLETQNFCKTMIFELGFFESTNIANDKTSLGSNQTKKEGYDNLTQYFKPFSKFYENNLERAVSLVIAEAQKECPRRRLILGKDAQIKIEIENMWVKKDLEYSKKYLSSCYELSDDTRELLKNKNIDYIKYYLSRICSIFNKDFNKKVKLYYDRIQRVTAITKYL